MPDVSTWAKITTRMEDLKELHDRMDKTRDQAYMKPFELMSFDGKRKLDNVINVTGNRPGVEANAIISDLMGSKWRIKVEGEHISLKQSHKIEEFINRNLEEADEFISNRFGILGLKEWLSNHVCIRSYLGARWISVIENNQFHVDCVPVDMRYGPFVFGQKTFEWVAPITFRNLEDLKTELPEHKEKIKGKGGKTKENEVRDYWDEKVNELLVDGQQIFTRENKTGSVPFVIVIPPAGFMLRDKGYLKHDGEDLFFLNRALYPEYNRSLSIEQSIGMDILNPPYVQETEQRDASPPEAVPKTGQVKKYKKGEAPVPLKRGDLNNASMAARSDIGRMLQHGGINDIDLGNVSQEVSAVWITEQSEIRNKLIRPRVRGIERFIEKLARLMIKQTIHTAKDAGSDGFMVGQEGKRQMFKVSDLGNPDTYSITCTLKTTSKKQEVANWAVANMAVPIAPLEIILRDILMVDDPDEWMRKLDLQKARKADPAIGMLAMAIRCVEESDELDNGQEADEKRIEAEMLMERFVALVTDRKNPQPQQLPDQARIPQEQAQPKEGMNDLMPLMGRTGVPGGAPVTTPKVE